MGGVGRMDKGYASSPGGKEEDGEEEDGEVTPRAMTDAGKKHISFVFLKSREHCVFCVWLMLCIEGDRKLCRIKFPRSKLSLKKFELIRSGKFNGVLG